MSQKDVGAGGKGSTGQPRESRSAFKGNVRLGRHYFLVSDRLCLAQTNSLGIVLPGGIWKSSQLAGVHTADIKTDIKTDIKRGQIYSMPCI